MFNDSSNLKYKTILCEASVATFRTIGDTGRPQNLFTLENGALSGIDLEITRLRAIADNTVALTVGMKLRVSRPIALPTGGTTLTKKLRDTLASSNSLVVARGATASDGGAATKITAVAEDPLFAAGKSQVASAVGQIVPYTVNLLPGWPLTVHAGESVLVDFFPIAAENPSTGHFLVCCSWREYTAL